MYRSFLLSTVLLAAGTAAAEPADPWLPQAQQMNRDTVRKEDPAAKLHLTTEGRLPAQESKPYQIELRAGRYYSFFADCDRNCTDLDIVLRHQGSILKSSSGRHAFPAFGWQAGESGHYILTLTMEQCRTAGCRYSIQVFEGQKPVF